MGSNRYDEYSRDSHRRGDSRETRYYGESREYRRVDSELRDEIDRLYDELYQIRRSNADMRYRRDEAVDLYRGRSKDHSDELEAINNKLDELAKRLDKFEKRDEDIVLKISAAEERLHALQNSLDYQTPFKNQMEKVNDEISKCMTTKFGSRTLPELWNKVSGLSAIIMANLVGTVMLIALICFYLVNNM